PDAVLVRDPDARVGKRRQRGKRTHEPSRESDRRAHFPPPMCRPEARASPFNSANPTALRSGRRQRIVSTLGEDISRIFAQVLLICGDSGTDQPPVSLAGDQDHLGIRREQRDAGTTAAERSGFCPNTLSLASPAAALRAASPSHASGERCPQ